MKSLPKIILPIAFALSLMGMREGMAEEEKGFLPSLGAIFGPSWIEGDPPRPPVGVEKPWTPAQTAPEPPVAKFSSQTKVPSGGATVPTLWLPMCFLFDPLVDSKKANEKIKEMAGAYAACGIALEPHAFTLKPNYPKDFVAVGAAALTACPLNSLFGVRGAIQIESRYPQLAKQMCQDPQAKGCSTLCAPLSISFVEANASPTSGLHESMHSNCCGPLCVNEGEGGGISGGPSIEIASYRDECAGKIKRVQALKRVTGLAATVSEEGCQALRAGASKNNLTHWYEPEKRTYYVPETDPNRQKDLMAGKSFFLDSQMIAAAVPAAEVTAVKPVDPTNRILEDLSKSLKAADENQDRPFKSPGDAAVSSTASKSANRNPASSEAGPVDELGEVTAIGAGRARNRGEGLRKQGDVQRKSSGSDIGFIDAYGGSGEGD